MNEQAPHTFVIPESAAGKRLDKVLADMLPDYSRSCLQNWLKHGYITIDGSISVPKHKVQGEELVRVEVPEEEPPAEIIAEPIDLNIIYQDPALIIVNKAAGMVVHPAVGNPGGTLQNALLHHFPELVAVPRSGLVHRLDKDTSGLLMVARNLKAHKRLVEQLQQREVHRQYDAVAQGLIVAGGTVAMPIGRHPGDRKRMAVSRGGREAITHYRIAEKFFQHTHLKIKLETGRTHQIRVHMAYLKKPLVGDPVYGGRLKIPAACSDELSIQLQTFKRQALHAAELGIVHPDSGQAMQWQVSMPADMQTLLQALREDSRRRDER